MGRLFRRLQKEQKPQFMERWDTQRQRGNYHKQESQITEKKIEKLLKRLETRKHPDLEESHLNS